MTGAKINWSMDMTNMRMGAQTGQMTDIGSGRYQASGYFSMGGPWRINVDVARNGQAPERAYFDFGVR